MTWCLWKKQAYSTGSQRHSISSSLSHSSEICFGILTHPALDHSSQTASQRWDKHANNLFSDPVCIPFLVYLSQSIESYDKMLTNLEQISLRMSSTSSLSREELQAWAIALAETVS